MTDGEKAARIAKHRADMPLKYRKLYDRVVAGKASPREAIKMQCLECWAYVKSETKSCDNYACNLFAFKPYQKPVKSPTETLGQLRSNEKRQRDS
jgi:hypothetical protein